MQKWTEQQTIVKTENQKKIHLVEHKNQNELLQIDLKVVGTSLMVSILDD